MCNSRGANWTDGAGDNFALNFRGNHGGNCPDTSQFESKNSRSDFVSVRFESPCKNNH